MKIKEIKKTRCTYNKKRFTLFLNSYANYLITDYLRKKYEIDPKNRKTTRQISNIAKVLRLNTRLLQRTIFNKYPPRLVNFNKAFRDEQREKIKVYISIEREIILLTIAKHDIQSLVAEDYERAILAPAIERVAGNRLKNIKDDLIFEIRLQDLKRKYQNWYYLIAYQYKLPTPRLLPFILRLISF